MYDKALFVIEKNDAKYLDRVQVNKARYWFKKFIGICLLRHSTI
jgi:hypothetical protein